MPVKLLSLLCIQILILSLAFISGCSSSTESSDSNEPNNGGSGGSNGNGGDNIAVAEICDTQASLAYVFPDPIFANLVFDAAPISDGLLFFLGDDASDELSLQTTDAQGTVSTLLQGNSAYTPPGAEAGNLFPNTFSVGPFSSECGIPERLAVQSAFREEGSTNSSQFLARLTDVRSPSIDPVSFFPVTVSGTQISNIGKLKVGACGDIVGTVSNSVYATLGGGNTFQQIVANGAAIPMSNSPGMWGNIRHVAPRGGDVDIYANILGGQIDILGRFSGPPFDSFKCFATSATAGLDCNISGARLLADAGISSDRFAVATSEGIRFVDIDADVSDSGTLIAHNQTIDGVTVSVSQPNVCESTNDVFFVGNWVGKGNFWQDLFVMRNEGGFERLTDFSTLATGEEEARVPDVIEGYSLGEFCDAAIMGRNGQHKSIWTVWRDGTLARLLKDEATFEIAPGDTREVQSLEFNLSSNSFDGRIPAIDKDGRVSIGVRLEDVPSLARLGFLIGEQKIDECRAPANVNVTTDLEDNNPGDGACDTGGPEVDGAAECSLRAAIMEANAQTGTQRIDFDLEASDTITTSSPLPDIIDAVTIDAPLGLTLDLSSAGAQDGLAIAAADVTIRGLSLQNAGGYGINISVGPKDVTTLSSVTIQNSCDFGIFTGGHLVIDDALGSPAIISNNGGGTGCDGGGIYSTASENDGVGTRLTGVELNSNIGAGLLAAAPVVLSRVVANFNQGPGIAATFNGAGLGQTRVRIEFGETETRGNEGDGILVESGNLKVKSHASLVSEDNIGWGVYIDVGTVDFGGSNDIPTVQSSISNNGQPGNYYTVSINDDLPERLLLPPDANGGIFVYTLGRDVGAPQRLQNMLIENNLGAGVLSVSPVVFSLSTVRNNFGDGIVIAQSDFAVNGDQTGFRSEFGEVRIENNRGHGVLVEGAAAIVGSGSQFSAEGNGGWGLYADGSIIIGNVSQSESQPRTNIENNGAALSPCRYFNINASGVSAFSESPCIGGGLRIDEGDLNATGLNVVGNSSEGILANNPGNVTILDGQVCDNGTDIVAEGATALTGVSMDCL